MKQIFLFLIALILATAANCQNQIVIGPAIEVDRDIHDYGTIGQESDGRCEFLVTNIGSEPLVISSCQASCGCTTPKCNKAPIMPGKNTYISVIYDTKRIGPFTKGVTINSNAVNESEFMLTITGTVEKSEE